MIKDKIILLYTLVLSFLDEGQEENILNEYPK
jgi:hypothetical protein